MPSNTLAKIENLIKNSSTKVRWTTLCQFPHQTLVLAIAGHSHAICTVAASGAAVAVFAASTPTHEMRYTLISVLI